MTKSSLLTQIDNAITSPSRENFCSTFAIILQHLQLTDLEVAKDLQISKPTVGRWARGESCVHLVGRAPVLNYLREKVVEHEQSN